MVIFTVSLLPKSRNVGAIQMALVDEVELRWINFAQDDCYKYLMQKKVHDAHNYNGGEVAGSVINITAHGFVSRRTTCS